MPGREPIEEYTYDPNDPDAIVSELTTGKVVTIEVWEDGISVSLVSNVCHEVGDTGFYSWSTTNLPLPTKNRTQYQFAATDEDDNSVVGDFILVTIEGGDGNMPQSLSDYIQ